MASRWVRLVAGIAVGVFSLAAATPAGAEGTVFRIRASGDEDALLRQWLADPKSDAMLVSELDRLPPIDSMVAGRSDADWTGIAPSDTQRQSLRDQGRGEPQLVPVVASTLAIVGPPGSTTPVTSSELCSAVTAMTEPSGWGKPAAFVVTSQPSGDNMALSDFCIHREPAIWEAYRAAVAASPEFSPYATPEFLRGEPTPTFPRTPGLTFGSESYAVAGVIRSSGDVGNNSGARGLWGVVQRFSATINRLSVRPLTDGTVQHITDDGTAALALDEAVVRPDGTLSTQVLPLADAYPLVSFGYLLIARRGDQVKDAAIDRMLTTLLGTFYQSFLGPQLGNVPLTPRILQLARDRQSAFNGTGGPTPVVPEFPVAPIGVLITSLAGAAYALRRRQIQPVDVPSC